MTVAPEFQTERFQRFLTEITPIATRIAGRRASTHPLLAKPDLMARALEVCLHVWQRYHASVADEDVLRISVSAMDRRLRNERRGTLAFGEAEVQIVSLTDSVPGRTRETYADTLVAEPVETLSTTAAKPPEVLQVGDVVRVVASRVPRLIGSTGRVIYAWGAQSKHYRKTYRVRVGESIVALSARNLRRVDTSWNLDVRALVPEDRYRPLLRIRLGRDARIALREILAPSAATWDRYTQIVVGEWTSEGVPVRAVQRKGITHALMAGLGWELERAERAWNTLSRAVRDAKRR